MLQLLQIERVPLENFDDAFSVKINCAMHHAVCDASSKKQTFHETDITERESISETGAEELEENECQEIEDLRSGINI